MKHWTLIALCALLLSTVAHARDPVPLCDALKPRAMVITELVTSRSINQQGYGGWKWWGPAEGLSCEHTDTDTVVYRRSCKGVSFDCKPADTWVVFDNIHPSDFKITDWGTPEVLDTSVVNSYEQEIIIPDGSKVSHTWSNTSTLVDSLLNVVTVGLKARSLTILGSVYQGQFSEQIEVEISASYQRQFGETTTRSTTDTVTLEETGPKQGRFLFQRTNTRERRRVVSNVDLEHTIEFAGNWHGKFQTVVEPDYKAGTITDFINGAEGLLPTNHSISNLFTQGKAAWPIARLGSPQEIANLKKPANSPVEVEAVYSTVSDKFLFEESGKGGPDHPPESKQ